MNLTSPSQVKAWCIENGFHPNRNLGQNFLIDRNTLEDIVSASGVKVGGHVLEIGPGLGVLTECLLDCGVNVYAIEKDTRLAERLQANVATELSALRAKSPRETPQGNLTLVAADALETDWDALLTEQKFDACVSNLPYSVGTRILLDIAMNPFAPRVLTVLVQTEVAERFAAGPGDEPRGQAGVWLQLDYDVTIVREVKASCFWPKPEVGSSLVRMDRHVCPLSQEARKTFHAVTKLAFMHRRKQLGGILRKSTFSSSCEEALTAANIPKTTRPEELSNAQWVALANRITG